MLSMVAGDNGNKSGIERALDNRQARENGLLRPSKQYPFVSLSYSFAVACASSAACTLLAFVLLTVCLHAAVLLDRADQFVIKFRTAGTHAQSFRIPLSTRLARRLAHTHGSIAHRHPPSKHMFPSRDSTHPCLHCSPAPT